MNSGFYHSTFSESVFLTFIIIRTCRHLADSQILQVCCYGGVLRQEEIKAAPEECLQPEMKSRRRREGLL